MLVWLQGGLQPFRWQKHDSVPHRGQPDVFDFQFELMKPWSWDPGHVMVLCGSEFGILQMRCVALHSLSSRIACHKWIVCTCLDTVLLCCKLLLVWCCDWFATIILIKFYWQSQQFTCPQIVSKHIPTHYSGQAFSLFTMTSSSLHVIVFNAYSAATKMHYQRHPILLIKN